MSDQRTFAGIGEEYAAYEQAKILLQSIPYDGTSTWGKGADRGFEAFLEAAENMELFDIETGTEVYRHGIHIPEDIAEKRSPEQVYERVRTRTEELLASGKFLTFFGGEHSVSIGIIEAFAQHFPGLSVLQMDAHADLRPSYLGSEFNHACAMHRASRQTRLMQVGIRSMDISEKQWINPEKCFFAHEMDPDPTWVERSLSLLGKQVYLSIDLDVLDPSIMPSTGTPEPGGMDWYPMLAYLRRVFEEKEVVGFDIVEFAPIPSIKAPDLLVAKLYYKLLSYKFHKSSSHE
jgi:agmatinase